MTRCQVPFEMLLNVYEGRGDRASLDVLRDHLATGCSSCQQSWRWLQRVLAASKEMDSVPIPEWPTALATARFRERYAIPARPKLLARLSFDSHLQSLSALARGDQELSRHLIYSTDDYDVELWQEMISRQACYLIGQVLPKQGGAAMHLQSVSITDVQDNILSVTPKEVEFHLPFVSAGLYQMRIALPEAEICLSDVMIGVE